jgi:hypothetical protein
VPRIPREVIPSTYSQVLGKFAEIASDAIIFYTVIAGTMPAVRINFPQHPARWLKTKVHGYLVPVVAIGNCDGPLGG